MNLLVELQRRNVIRVAVAYGVLSWLLLQVSDLVFDALALPEWSLRLLLVLLALGAIPVLIFAWAYELTPEGVKRESEVDRSQSVAPTTSRRLDRITLVLMLVAIGLFLTEGWWRGSSMPPEHSRQVADGNGSSIPLAVLPFENMSADADNAYFADGISEEILNLLSDVGELSVASRTSSFAFKGKDVSIPDIAAALGVRYVLEGSVRKAGEQVRITAQLIDAASDRHLWSDTFDRSLDDIFAVQDEMAAAIGAALQVELLGSGGERIQADSIDPEVYARFLEARHKLRSRIDEEINAANGILMEVVALEPRFARGHVLLGEALLLAKSSFIDRALALRLAGVEAAVAREFNPDLAGIDLIRGAIAEDPFTALRHYQRAIELEPNEPRPYHWRGILLHRAGYLERATPDLEQALRLDPENPHTHFPIADVLGTQGEFDRAERLTRRAIEELGSPGGWSLLAGIQCLRGDMKGTASTLRLGLGNDDDHVDVLEGALAGNGWPKTVDDIPGEWPVRVVLALVMCLERPSLFYDYLDQRSFSDMLPMIWSDRYRALRKDPRFLDLVGIEIGLDLWREWGPPPDCRVAGDTFTCGHGFGSTQDTGS